MVAKRPGRMRVRHTTGELSVEVDTIAATEYEGRQMTLTVGECTTLFQNAETVERVAAHLRHVAAWMRQGERNAQAMDDFEDIMQRFRSFTQRTAS